MAPTEPGRYRREGDEVVIEVAVRNSRQLFNERDPAPFRERDLDSDFVTYVMSAVQEFPASTKMRLKLIVLEESEGAIDRESIFNAIHSYFAYEAQLTEAKLRKRFRVSRGFLLIGLLTLVTSLSLSQAVSSLFSSSALSSIIQEGFIIIGWVAMWRPIEAILYDWWPLREQRLVFLKIAALDVSLQCSYR